MYILAKKFGYSIAKIINEGLYYLLIANYKWLSLIWNEYLEREKNRNTQDMDEMIAKNNCLIKECNLDSISFCEAKYKQ